MHTPPTPWTMEFHKPQPKDNLPAGAAFFSDDRFILEIRFASRIAADDARATAELILAAVNDRRPVGVAEAGGRLIAADPADIEAIQRRAALNTGRS